MEIEEQIETEIEIDHFQLIAPDRRANRTLAWCLATLRFGSFVIHEVALVVRQGDCEPFTATPQIKVDGGYRLPYRLPAGVWRTVQDAVLAAYEREAGVAE